MNEHCKKFHNENRCFVFPRSIKGAAVLSGYYSSQPEDHLYRDPEYPWEVYLQS
jgi:hypothetical protein